MVPSLTLLADTTAEQFPTLLQTVRQACDAVFDDPYRFEVVDRGSDDRGDSRVKSAHLIGEAPNLKRRITNLEDSEGMILQLIEFKNSMDSLESVTEFLHRSRVPENPAKRRVA